MTDLLWSQWLACHVTERGPMSSPLFKRGDGIAHWAKWPSSSSLYCFYLVEVLL